MRLGGDSLAETILEMKEINKYFSGVCALDHAQLDLRKGEVLALIGENGAGKSTLMKILTGVYTKDGGTILYKGKELELHSPKDALDMGIGIIHQELNLMNDMTVADNIFVGREIMKGLIVDRKAENAEAAKLLGLLHMDIDPDERVGTLTVARQQMVEIAKALSYNSEVLIMDEPTAALTVGEIKDLFTVIRRLREQGKAIIFISHRMEELFDLSDRITVMRDGKYVGTKNTKETDVQEIIHMMVGRVIYEEAKDHSEIPEDAPIVLEAENLQADNVKNVSFYLRKGEILGFAGLVGAGRTETMLTLFGATPKKNGIIRKDGTEIRIHSPSDAVKAGIGYLSEDRKRYGLATSLTVADNTVMASLKDYVSSGLIRDRDIERISEESVKRLAIRTPGVHQTVKNLSGGNQQKVVIAKWLLRNCEILIFDEPTRGIDVGAKNEIYHLMKELVSEGKSIIMISSEMPELLRLSDRIIVMCEGRKTGELRIEETTQEKIMALATAEQ